MTFSAEYFSTVGAPGGCSPGAPLPPCGKVLGKIKLSDFRSQMDKVLSRYNHEHRKLVLTWFAETDRLLTSVDRVLSAPCGNLLFAGRAGVGRRSSVSLIANLHQMTVVTPKIGVNYGIKQFYAELKQSMQLAGIEEQQVVLILEDKDTVTNGILEAVNSLLASGDVPGLYTPEELDPLLAPLRDQASQDAFRGTMYAYFAKRVKENLHVALIFDSSAQDFQVNCLSNPSFFKECTVIWMDQWSEESMAKIPKQLIESQLQDIADGSRPKTASEQLYPVFSAIFQSCASTENPVRKFTAMIESYVQVYYHRRGKIQEKQERLKGGVGRLNEAREVVATLKEKAAEQSKLLAEKQANADHALKQITNSMTAAGDQKGEMEQLKADAEKENARIEEQKNVIDAQLAEVEPLIAEAKRAVGGIKPDALSEIRSLRAPPETIRDILEAVLLLMGIFDSSWQSMRSFLAKNGVQDEIMNFDARRVTPEIRKSVEQHLKKKAASFDLKNVKRASTVAPPLASWVKANVEYAGILEKISPLESQKAKLLKNLQKTEKQMDKLGKGLTTVDEAVAELKRDFEMFTTEATKVKIELDRENEIIRTAETLVNGLHGEYERWNSQVKELEKQLAHLGKFALLAAAYLTLVPHLPEVARKAHMTTWLEHVGLQKFNVKKFLSSESEQLTWKGQGLPSDSLSIENAICILNAVQTPLVIDPSNRVIQWLKSTAGQTTDEVNQSDRNFGNQLELAVRFGKTLMITEVDNIHPVLFPLLRKDHSMQGPRSVVQVGEKTLDCHPDFRLFLFTRNSSLRLRPDETAAVCIINFTTTVSGLTSQLLTAAIQQEKPDLEKRKSELLKQEDELRLQLDGLEQQLLEELSKAEGNILENKTLITSLNKAKESSEIISNSLTDSVKLQSSLDQERNVYLPLAEHGSKLYFALLDLKKLNNMYRYSLGSFLAIFSDVLKVKQKTESQDLLLKQLIHTLQINVLEYVSRSLFNKDRLSFAMHLVKQTQPNWFQKQEWEFLIGMTHGELAGSTQVPSWIPESAHSAYNDLRTSLPQLYSMADFDNSTTWSNFMSSAVCETEFPEGIAKKTTPIQQVLILKTIRPDRAVTALENFVNQSLSAKHYSPHPQSFKDIFEESTAAQPILFILSAGVDVSQEVRELAHTSVSEAAYSEIAMGEGQEEEALRRVKAAAEVGGWVALYNLHLVTAWLPQLEKAPPGIKRNLERTFSQWHSQGQQLSSEDEARCCFVLAWLHAVLQERRSFMPQAWSKFYEFNQSDISVSKAILKDVATKHPQWEFITGLLSYAVYGGRIDNDIDSKVLTAYLEQHFNQTVIGRNKKLPQVNLVIPSSTNIQDFHATIQSLPEDDEASMFGLPKNIKASSQRAVLAYLIEQLSSLSRPSLESIAFERERWSRDLQGTLGTWKRLNQGNSLHVAELREPDMNVEDPVKSFLQLEHFNALTLVQTVHRTLSGISKALKGTDTLTAEGFSAGIQLLQAKTPDIWLRQWNGPANDVDFMTSLIKRATAVDRMLKNVDSSTIQKETIDISDFFRPGTFLNALRLHAASSTKSSIDRLHLQTTWHSKSITSTVKLNGFQIEGATFDGSYLRENSHVSPLNSPMPEVGVAWLPNEPDDKNSVKIPIYVDNTREEIVTTVRVPCSDDPDTWTIMGVAIFIKS